MLKGILLWIRFVALALRGKRAWRNAIFAATVVAHPVFGADPPPAKESKATLRTNVTLASQYVSRGYQLSWGKPALQGGADYIHPSGAFAGTWMSTVSPKILSDGYMEWDLYAGYSAPVGPLSFKGALYYYIYPSAGIPASANASGDPVKYDYGELLLSATWKWVTVNHWYTYTEDYYGSNGDTLFDGSGSYYRNGKHSRGSGYLDINFDYEVGNGYSAGLHYGYQHIENFHDWDSADYKIGITKTFNSVGGSKGWNVGAHYIGVTKVNDYYKNRNAAVPFVLTSGEVSKSGIAGNQFIVTVGRIF